MKKRFWLLLSIFLLVLAGLTIAFSCTSSNYCQSVYNSTSYSCVNQVCQKADKSSSSVSSSTLSSSTTSTFSFASTSNVTLSYCLNSTKCVKKYGTGYACIKYQCKKMTPTKTTASSSADYNSVVEQIRALKDKLNNLTSDKTRNTQLINSLNRDLKKISGEIDALKSEQQNIKSTSSKTAQVTNTISTGLASLQKEVKSADTKISNLSGKVQAVEKARPLTKTVLLIILFLVVFGGVLAFILFKRSQEVDVPLELKKYIHQNLNQNKNYATLRKELVGSGWTGSQVDVAYKEVISHRYKKYSESKKKALKTKPFFLGGNKNSPATTPVKKVPAVTPKSSSTDPSKKKIFIIGGISLGVIVLLFVVLWQADVLSGQAIKMQYAYDESKPFVCTPPHIETVGGCCLDENKNNKCDKDEEYAKKKTKAMVAAPTVCQDHNQCGPGKFCINNKCGTLTQEYKTVCPKTKRCYPHDLAILTSDGEVYQVHAKQGSYTAAGALAWTVKTIPAYCTGAPIKIPIEIEKTDLVCYDDLGQEISCNQDTGITCSNDQDCSACPGFYGVTCSCSTQKICVKNNVEKTQVKIVGKEIIILKVGQTSPIIKHPNSAIDKQIGGFTLTLIDAQEDCY